MSKVLLISGWSNPGGSTIHHIALTNLLNDNGIDCTFYGPHEYHLNKCKSGTIADLGPAGPAKVEKDDIVISHFVLVPPVEMKKHILSCHETTLWDLKKMDPRQYDVIQFVSNSQKKWHGVNHSSVIIPPIVEKVNWTKPNNGVAGIVGSVDVNKQTHISIQKALDAGFSKVHLYGRIVQDIDYFNEKISPYMQGGDVVMKDHYDNKEEMYNEVDAVFHYSASETYGLVEAECRLAGIPFFGLENNREIFTKEEILEKWIKLLK